MFDEAFEAWCKRNGVVKNGVNAGFVEDGWRGLVATQHIQPDQCILEVPEDLLICNNAWKSDENVACVMLEHRTLSPVQV
jgi:hypothetical protein